MPLAARVPPGRAGRIWLRRRLATAVAGRDQLDRKLRILIPELQGLRIQADHRRLAWEAACADARTWLVRAAMLGGQDVLRAATPADPAEVEVTWTTAMGLRYPVDAAVTNAEPSPSVPGNAAIPAATQAFCSARDAALRAAAADEAVRRIEAEVAVTRRRLRALDKRWLPWLQSALADLELSLEQAEQEDGTRLRRAVASAPERRSP